MCALASVKQAVADSCVRVRSRVKRVRLKAGYTWEKQVIDADSCIDLCPTDL